MLLTDTAKTKETATLQKKLIEKRNLFGLGVTSLIAACSADGAGGGGTTTTMPPGDGRDETPAEKAAREQEDRANALPFKAGALTNSGYTAEIEKTSVLEGGTAELDVKITKDAASTFLNFPTGGLVDQNTANIHKLTPNLGQYDLVISAYKIDKNSGSEEENKGRIFIYWDVAKVATAPDPKDSPHLEIKGAKKGDQIGINAPDFLKIGGTDNKYDMIIRSYAVDKGGNGGQTNEGAIYILWDIVDYAEETKTIDLNPTALGNANTGATSGSLAIYGAKTYDSIGISAPDFLQIGGVAGDNYDMVIRSHKVDSSVVDISISGKGAIYVLWDVEDYYKDSSTILNKRIDLNTLDDNSNGATSGSLAIHGVRGKDGIGRYAPEFLQIGGKEGDNKLDMVIRSDLVDKSDDNDRYASNEGAIYVLWDVEDYYSIPHKTINLGAAVSGANGSEYATSGLLTIYGAATRAWLGDNANNILYGSDAAGNKTLTNIDKGHASDSEKNDIVFRDGSHTYVLFGDKVATLTGTKVASKTIDLGNLTGLPNSGDGYFGYNFGNGNVGNVGYRFVGRKTDLKAVQDNFPEPAGATLSDADADLGVWDIA